MEDTIAEKNEQISELDKKIEDLEKQLKYGLTKNEAGGFYEKETENIISVGYFSSGGLGLYSHRIIIESQDDDLTFILSAQHGRLIPSNSKPSGNTVELKTEEYARWGWYEQGVYDETTAYPDPIYVDIVAKNGDKIVGYGVVKIFKETDWESSIKLLKFVFIPQIDGEYQTVTQEQVQAAIDALKQQDRI